MNLHLQRYLELLGEERGLAMNTLQSYRRDLAQYLGYLAEKSVRLEDSSRVHIQGYFLHLKKLGRASATVNRCLVSIRSFYQYLVAEHVLDHDPAVGLEAPRLERKMPSVLTVEEVGRLLEAPRTDTPYGLRDKAMLELLYATGIRVTELVSLDRGHVYLDLGFIRCSGKGEKERMIPIHPQAALWLQRYLESGSGGQDGDTGALFANHLGGRLSRQGFWKIIKKHAADSGILGEITPHTLRHSFAVHLLENGADLKALQEMLGHADLSSTIMYVKSNPERMKDIYNRAHPRTGMVTP
ncbi:site-specific tyrosine recombinase XerD [Paenibacillus mesotrionivorans]|uniref:Site-specific tyrosine recombinase XerD n=1 Tax=Paenibacillus mesotrionivorans TaxID=3160968 RepID=A0ACC7P336_9BACL